MQRPSGVKCGWSKGQRGRQARPAGLGVRGRAGTTFCGSQVSWEVSAGTDTIQFVFLFSLMS